MGQKGIKYRQAFYTADSITELGDIFDIVSSYFLENAATALILADIEYEALLPEGVFVVEVPENMEVSTVNVDGVQRSKVKGIIKDVNLSSTDGIEYKIPEHSFDIKVRFLKPGEVVFSGEDELIRYIFKLEGAGGEDMTKTIEENFGGLTVYVKMTIDIS